VQESRRLGKPSGSVAWWEHLRAAEEYGKYYRQSARRLAERGGFGYGELIKWLGHEPETWTEELVYWARGRFDHLPNNGKTS